MPHAPRIFELMSRPAMQVGNTIRSEIATMLRRTLSSLALAAVVAVPAAAQSPWQVDAKFHNYGSATAYDRYSANIDGKIFQVFCVNPELLVNDNELYADAWVTPFSASNDSHVINPNGNDWLGNYTLAAQVASEFLFNFNYQTAGLGLATKELLNRQYAVWQAMGFNVSGRDQYDATRVGQILAAAAANAVVYPNQWLVLTNAQKNRQEFIYFDPSRPQETVPEPATMTLLATGLAGMAAARRRRNNKS